MKLYLSLLLTLFSLSLSAQTPRLEQNVTYKGEISAVVSDKNTAPFWFSSNRYGLSSIKGTSGYLRGAIERHIESDSLYRWKYGYGIDAAVAANYTSTLVLQQLYGEIEYGYFRLTLGSKEQGMEFNNEELSMGEMTTGINARPIPQVRVYMPKFFPVPFTLGLISFKGYMSYGWYTDNSWQSDFTRKKSLYTHNSLYHNKALYVKLGNEKLFPLTFTTGLEMSTQFGGEVWNLAKRADDTSTEDISHSKMARDLDAYITAFKVRGSDPNDGKTKNTAGNVLGSWHASMKYQGNDWSVRGYFEHFFDDQSQMFFYYGWKDYNLGLEVQLPKNKIANTVVLEYLCTKDQTGGIYHEGYPEQISGKDNYYTNHVYGGWQHWGMAIGNPLLISPIYNSNHQITFLHNRVQAGHIGVEGDPTEELHYRMLCTYMKSWGTYDRPLKNIAHSTYLLGEVTYKPKKYDGWSVIGSVGINSGTVINNCVGFMATLRKEGILKW